MDIETLVAAFLTSEETYRSGDIIIEEGTKGDWIYVVLDGQVKVAKKTSAGMLTLGVLKRGAVFGEMSLFGTALKTRGASVIASDGPVRVGVLDTHQVIDDYESISPRIRLLIKALIMGLRESNEKAAALVVAANEKRRKD